MKYFMIGLTAVLFVSAANAADFSERYYACRYQEDVEAMLSCTKEEDYSIRRRIAVLVEELEKMPEFASLKAQNLTIKQQMDDWQKYTDSYCEYHTFARYCEEEGDQRVTKAECILVRTQVMLESLEDLYNGIKKKNSKKTK